MARMWMLDVVGWEELQAVVSPTGAVLITRPSPNTGLEPSQFADRIGGPGLDEAPIWTSAHRAEAGWLWGDGPPVASSSSQTGGLNGDRDLSNDTKFAALSNGKSSDGPGYTAILYSSAGTPYRNHLVDGLEMGAMLKLQGGGGYHDGLVNGGLLDLGSGDDQAALGDALAKAATIIIDGAGSDHIKAGQSVIKATPDGVADYFITAGRVSFAAGTRGIFAVPNAMGGVSLSSLEFGDDYVRSNHIVGTPFGDTIAGASRISGGRGDDVLTPTRYAEGGEGDDTLIAISPQQRVELRGEAGNDTLLLYSPATVSGGAGNDRFVLGAVVQITINDLASGDRIDISDLLGAVGQQDPFDGFLKLSILRGYTHLWIDQNGGGDHYTELVTLKGQYAGLDDFLLL